MAKIAPDPDQIKNKLIHFQSLTTELSLWSGLHSIQSLLWLTLGYTVILIAHVTLIQWHEPLDTIWREGALRGENAPPPWSQVTISASPTSRVRSNLRLGYSMNCDWNSVFWKAGVWLNLVLTPGPGLFYLNWLETGLRWTWIWAWQYSISYLIELSSAMMIYSPSLWMLVRFYCEILGFCFEWLGLTVCFSEKVNTIRFYNILYMTLKYFQHWVQQTDNTEVSSR